MYQIPNCDCIYFQEPFGLSHCRQPQMNWVRILDVEEMIESRRPLLEFLLNLRNKCQLKKKYPGKFKKEPLARILIQNPFIMDTG